MNVSSFSILFLFVLLYRRRTKLTKDRPLTCSIREIFRTCIEDRKMTLGSPSYQGSRTSVRAEGLEPVALPVRACLRFKARIMEAHLSFPDETFKINSCTALQHLQITIKALHHLAVIAITLRVIARSVEPQTSARASSPVRIKAITQVQALIASNARP